MEGMVNVEWHGQDYLHLKWHVVCSRLATPDLNDEISIIFFTGFYSPFHCEVLSLAGPGVF